MNKLSILALVILISAACKKSSTTASTGGSSFIGTWKWVLSTGGFAGVHETPASTGKHLTYIFRTDSSCSVISDTSTVNGIYHLSTDNVYNPSHPTTMISIGTSPSFVLSYYNDTLALEQGYVDGFNYYFVRQ